MGRVVIVLSLLVWIIIIVAGLSGGKPDIELFLYATLFAAVFSAFGLFVIRLGSVKVVLTKDGIVIQNGRRSRSIPYSEVRSISYESKWYDSVVLHTDGGRIAIRRDLVGYPELIDAVRKATGIRDEEAGDTLRITCKTWEIYVCCGIFIVLLLAFLVLIIVGAATGEVGLGTSVVCSLVVLLFIASFLFPALYFPRKYEFAPDAIVKTSLMGGKRFDPSGITRVEYGQQMRKTSSRYGSRISHFIEIQFSDKKKYVRIDQSILNYPLENIAAYVKKTYNAQDRFFEVSLQDKSNDTEK